MKYSYFLQFLIILLFYSVLISPIVVALTFIEEETSKTIRIGIQKNIEIQSAERELQPFIHYLQTHLPEYRIEAKILSTDSLINAISWGEVDFAFCNPYIYLISQHHISTSVLATVIREAPEGRLVNKQAGVIFCKANRNDIQNLEDLKGKTFSAPGPDYFSGWLLPCLELKENNINPKKHFHKVIFSGSHEATFNLVLSGRVDAGSIGAFYLWKFIQEGKAKVEDIQVIHPKDSSRLVPYPHSTEVFPEMCVISLSHVPDEIQRKFALSLLEIPFGSEILAPLYITGFTVPLDYHPVERVSKELGLHPYETGRKITVREFLRQHLFSIIVLVIFWTIFIFSISLLFYTYRQVKMRHELAELLNIAKITQRNLEDSERRFRLLTENFPGAVYIRKNDDRYTAIYLIDGIRDITGYDKEEFLTDRVCFADIYLKEDAEYVFTEVNACLAERKPYHLIYRIVDKNGQIRWLEEIGIGVWDDDKLLYLQGYLWDITAKKHQEQREQEKTTRITKQKDIINKIILHPALAEGDLVKLAHFVTEEIGSQLRVPRVNVWLFNPDRTQLVCVDHYDLYSHMHSSGYVLKEEDFCEEFQVLKTTKYVDVVDALNDPRTRGYANNYLIPLCITSMLDVAIRVGEVNVGVICLEYTHQIHHWEEDEISFASQVADQLAIAIMNAERRKMEQHRVILTKAIEDSEIGTALTDAQGNIIYVNPSLTTILNIPKEEVINRNLLDLMEHLQLTAPDERLKLVQSNKEPVTEVVHFKVDHQPIILECTLIPVELQPPVISNFILYVKDITNQVKVEQDLRQAQKMESVGQLAGGIAHDLNNQLLVVQGYTELIKEELNVTSPLFPYVSEIEQATQKSTQLIRQILAFARKQILKKENISINQSIQNTVNILRRLITENVEIELIFDPNDPIVYGDRNAIEVVLLNLCNNANDAMPDGGKLTIETSSTYLTKDKIQKLDWVKEGEYAVISITDTGIGMDSYTLEHCFDPFFTTKEKGKGTGLGLSTAYGLVRQHNGLIHVYSELGKGTTFKIYLPISTQIQTQEELKAPVSQQSLTGTETILIAEDELSVLEVAKRILSQAGYKVLTAMNGEIALDLFKEHQDEIDMVILDIVMPKLGGKEVYEKIKQIKPDLPILFTTGYSENSVHTNFVLHAGLLLLNKPYSRMELLQTIRNILDSRKSQ